MREPALAHLPAEYVRGPHRLDELSFSCARRTDHATPRNLANWQAAMPTPPPARSRAQVAGLQTELVDAVIRCRRRDRQGSRIDEGHFGWLTQRPVGGNERIRLRTSGVRAVGDLAEHLVAVPEVRYLLTYLGDDASHLPPQPEGQAPWSAIASRAGASLPVGRVHASSAYRDEQLAWAWYRPVHVGERHHQAGPFFHRLEQEFWVPFVNIRSTPGWPPLPWPRPTTRPLRL